MGIVLGFGRGPNTARANNRALKTLQRDCDPGPLLEICRAAVVDEKLQEASPGVYSVLVTNLVNVSIAAGVGNLALNVLETMATDSARFGGPAPQVLYWLYVSCAHTQMEGWEEAAVAQSKAMAYFEQGGIGPEIKESLQRELCANGYALRIHSGHLGGLEEQIRQLLATAPDAWHRTENHLLLGKYYIAAGREAEAREHLDYAVVHGNKLYAKTEAEDLLRALAGEGPADGKRVREANWRVEREWRRMNDTCDPTPVLEACRAALADEAVLREKEVCATLHTSASVALVNLGRYDEARAEREQILLDEGQRNLADWKLGLLHANIVLDMMQGRLAEANQGQIEAMELYTKTGAENWRRPLCRNGCFLRIALGQLEGVEERVNWLVESAADEFDRVVDHMLMGRYLLAAGKKAEAAEHLRYVAEHGNKLHQRAEAEELLKGL